MKKKQIIRTYHNLDVSDIKGNVELKMSHYQTTKKCGAFWNINIIYGDNTWLNLRLSYKDNVIETGYIIQTFRNNDDAIQRNINKEDLNKLPKVLLDQIIQTLNIGKTNEYSLSI
jgi:hypothetical protein